MTSYRAIAIALLIAIISTSQSAFTQDITQARLILPVQTPLQQRLLVKDTGIYVVLNADVIILGGAVDPNLLDVNELRAGLEALRQSPPGRVVVRLRSTHPVGLEKAANLISAALRDVVESAGFKQLDFGMIAVNDNTSWQDFRTALGNGPDQPEPIVADTETFAAYAVHSRLSRFLTGNVDLVVEFKSRFDATKSPLETSTLVNDLARLIPPLQLKDTRTIMFRVHATAAGQTSVERFVQSEAKDLAEILGFKFAVSEISYE